MSFGVETAADVTHSAVRRVPGFGEVYTNKLTRWRRDVEKGFNYDPTPNAKDADDEKNLKARFASEKAKLEKDIQSGAATLRDGKVKIENLRKLASQNRVLRSALQDLAQAEVDLKHLGANIAQSPIKLSFDVISKLN